MSNAQSLLKKILKTILWVAAIVVHILVAVAVLIQIPAIQNKIIHAATSAISKKTNTKLEVKEFYISFPKSVVIKGLLLEDLQEDTLLYAGEAKINIAFKGLLSSKIDVRKFTLEDVSININRILTDSLYNFNFLLTSLSDTSNRPNVADQESSKWTFNIDKVALKQIRGHYSDEYGGNNVTAFLGNLDLKMDEMDLKKSIYSIDALLIEQLIATVLMKEPLKPDEPTKDNILPKIMANEIQIKNSRITYGDSIRKQSVFAEINRFELKDGSVDLQKQIVTSGSVFLSKSEVQFKTIDKQLLSDTIAENINSKENDWEVALKRIELDDNSLIYKAGTVHEPPTSFDAKFLDYRHLSLSATELYYSSAKTEASIKKFTATDHNNFSITKFETEFSMDPHSITAKKLHAKTTHSSILADLSMQFSSLKTLQDSLASIILHLNIENASIQNSDMLYFNPQLIKQPFFSHKTNITTISGLISGQVKNLQGKGMIITTGAKTVLTTDFSIIGLPDVKTAYFNFPDLKLISGKQDIEMIAGSSIPENIALPENTSIQAEFKGRIKSFESSINIGSSYGTANIIASIDENENFSGKIKIPHFDMGSLLTDTMMYGPVTLTAEVNGHGLDKNTITAQINVDIPQFYLSKYTYHNLTLDGNIDGQQFEGKVNLNDENAIINFEGLVNVTPDQEQYIFSLNVQGADLQKLQLTKDDIRIGLMASADLKGGAVDKLNGKAAVSNLIIAKGDKIYFLDSLLFASINEPNKSEFNLRNSLLNVNYSGTMSPTALYGEINSFINNYFHFSEEFQSAEKSDSSNFNFEITLHNHPILSEVLLPQLEEFEEGIIWGSYNSAKNDLKLGATINHLVYGAAEINDFVLDVHSDPSALNYKITSKNISSAKIKLDNFLFEGKLADNTLFADLSSIDDNQNKKIVIHSQLTKESGNYKLVIGPEDLYLMHHRWDIAEENYIEFGEDGFLIHHFFINNAVSQINITSVNNQFNDDLNIAIKNFKLDDISQIIEKDTSMVKGTIDGNILLKRVNDSYGIIADAKISELFFRDIPIGNLTVKADNPSIGKFDIDLNLSGDDNNLSAKGYFILPSEGINSISIETAISSLSMKTIEAFSMGQITETSGTVSGNLFFQGPVQTPEITGELVFNDAFIKPAVSNNILELKHETIHLKPDGMYFNSFTLLDANKNPAVIDGKIQMKQFKDIFFALEVNAANFLLLNTTFNDNKDYYGRMIIDSRININGPLTLPVVNGKLKMKEGSNFTFAVPEEKLTTDRGENVVVFKDSLTQNSILYRTSENSENKSRYTGVDLSTIIEIDKEATLRLLMDPSSNDSLVVKGEAALSFAIDRSGKMSLTGAYNLDEGSYLVSLETFVKRRFDILSGSTIIWNGDPLDADISINAKYVVRAAPYDLVATQISGQSDAEKGSYKLQYPFWVLLKLRGDILQPLIGFEIQLPPEDKGIIGGAVNQKLIMLNEDVSALNKQVFALLIMGRFIQENPLQTESGGASSLVRSTVSNFLSGQLNKLSSRFLPDTELNFDIQSYEDYQSGQAEGRTEVEIGIKQQLFNERITVQMGGSVDIEGEKAKQNPASEITTDVTVEFKLTEDGRFRLKGFRNNQYAGAIEGQLVETGGGIVYVRDFNKWKDFFRHPKRNKKRADK